LNIVMKAIGLTLTPSIENYANKKLAEAFRKRLQDFAQSAILRFTFTSKHVRDKDQRHTAAVSVNIRGSRVNISVKHANLYAAIDQLEQKLCAAIARLWNRKHARRGAGRHSSRLQTSPA
jgi:ribosomal subunit interface protein